MSRRPRSRGTRPDAPPAGAPAARPARPRAAAGLWLHGRHAVRAALNNPRRVCLGLLADPKEIAALGDLARRPGLEVEAADRAAVEAVVGRDAVHQGLALRVEPLPPADLDAATPADPTSLVLVLDGVTDPQNLGGILRSASAFGVRAVVLPRNNSAPVNAVVAKAASGALERVPVVEAANLARALERLKTLGYWIVGLDARAEASIGEAPRDVPLVLVLGAEGAGLRRLVAEGCDLRLRLPIDPEAESLNVSVAAGVALYALAAGRSGT